MGLAIDILKYTAGFAEMHSVFICVSLLPKSLELLHPHMLESDFIRVQG